MMSESFMDDVLTMKKERDTQEEIERVFIGMTEVALFHPTEEYTHGGENE
jgi:hypothetical protein